MRVHLARQDIEDKCQPLHAEQHAEEAVPPDGQILAPQRQDAEKNEHHKGREREFIVIDHDEPLDNQNIKRFDFMIAQNTGAFN
jgi:hypothetical protein